MFRKKLKGGSSKTVLILSNLCYLVLWKIYGWSCFIPPWVHPWFHPFTSFSKPQYYFRHSCCNCSLMTVERICWQQKRSFVISFLKFLSRKSFQPTPPTFFSVKQWHRFLTEGRIRLTTLRKHTPTHKTFKYGLADISFDNVIYVGF